MAICLVCGKYEGVGLEDAMRKGWIFARCPECQRGTPYDIARVYLSKSMGETNIAGFLQQALVQGQRDLRILQDEAGGTFPKCLLERWAAATCR